MSNEEKIAMLYDVFSSDECELYPELELDAFDGWDSMAKITFVYFMDDEYDKKITSDQIKSLMTVQDMLDLME